MKIIDKYHDSDIGGGTTFRDIQHIIIEEYLEDVELYLDDGEKIDDDIDFLFNLAMNNKRIVEEDG